tara:strand:- start:7018 stop:7941 length:924 start_codon:yes stop_codon:yes gene_type:complete
MKYFSGGFINLYKEPNISSLQSFRPLKKIFMREKIGHIGTLDPAAEGVLPIAIGKATRLIEFVLNENKIYKAIIEFGHETDTLDLEGKIINKGNTEHLNEQLIKDKLKDFIGEIDQIPPTYSAIKISGQRAYKMKRNGGNPKMPLRKINVSNINFIKFTKQNQNSKGPKVEVEIECATGFYVRSFARDLSYACKTVGTLTNLQRLSVSSLNINQAHKIQEIIENRNRILDFIIPMHELIQLPKILLFDNDISSIKNGKFIKLSKYESQMNMQNKESNFMCVDKNENIACIAKIDSKEQLIKPFKVLI